MLYGIFIGLVVAWGMPLLGIVAMRLLIWSGR